MGDEFVRFRDEVAVAAEQLYTDLAGLAYEQGRLDSTIEFLEKALRELEDSGAGNSKLAPALSRLGVTHACAGRYREAETYLRRALAMIEVLDPADPAGLAACTCSLGTVCRLLGDRKEAIAVAGRALLVAETHFGPEHLETAWALDLLGDIHSDAGDYTLALSLLRRALAIKEQVGLVDDWEISVTLRKLGELYLRQNRYNEAEPLLWRAVSIQESLVDHGSPPLGRLYSLLGKLYAKQRKFGPAEGLFRCSLAVFVRAYPPSHPDILTNLRRLAEVCHAQGKIAEGESTWNLARAILNGAQDRGEALTFEFRQEQRQVDEGLARYGAVPERI